jgi:hypothetical protein
MGEPRVLFAIAESCPFDALLVRNMKRAVNDLMQLNLKRFRVPQVQLAKYSALDVMKQALELLYEFSPSEKNYREAMRTIQVYSEGDEEMQRTVENSFRLIANAVYNAYGGQRQAESLAPEILFLQGVPFEANELQQSFRFVGVRPPEISPPSVKRTVFLDEGFEPYKLMLDGKIPDKQIQKGREEHWAKSIEATLNASNGTPLIRAAAEHVNRTGSGLSGALRGMVGANAGRLSGLLEQRAITLKVIHRIDDVNEVYGKK